MKKRPEVTDATREAFVSAFFQLAKIKSIYQITIREITNLAGYNRTTFYRYFEDVFALIEYAEDQFLQYARVAVESQLSENSIGGKPFFQILIRCFHENADRVSVLLSEQNRSHFLRRIKENLPMSSIYIRSNDSPKKQMIMDIYFYGIFQAISANLQSKNALSDEDLLDIIQGLFEDWYWPRLTDNS